MKIYTQTGDRGKTGLLSGERVAKDNARIQAYGDVDELNAVIGALAASLGTDDDRLREQLASIQSDLMHVGAWLAATPESAFRAQLHPVTEAHCRALEAAIDHLQTQLPELRSFVLPGGHPRAAWAHLARTVCRRAERWVVHLMQQPQSGGPAADDFGTIIAYINRLSDYFFVLARHLNHQAGTGDRLWRP